MIRAWLLLALAPVLAGCYNYNERPVYEEKYLTDYGRKQIAIQENARKDSVIHSDVIADGYTRSVGEAVAYFIKMDGHDCDHLLKIRDAGGYREAVCEGFAGIFVLLDLPSGSTYVTKIEP